MIIGKPVRHEFPEPRLRAKVESMELILIEQGFARVVFQLATATGRSIYPPHCTMIESRCAAKTDRRWRRCQAADVERR